MIFGSIFVVDFNSRKLLPLAEHLINKLKNNKDFAKDNSSPKNPEFIKKSLKHFGSNSEYSKI